MENQTANKPANKTSNPKPKQEVINIKAWMMTEAYQNRREALSKEINSNGAFTIDRSCFEHTKEERTKLKAAKKAYKKMVALEKEALAS